MLHFHDLTELVLFHRVDGFFWGDGRRQRLSSGMISFIPSMRHHDFALTAGEKSWDLIQIDPYIVEKLAQRSEFARLREPFCAEPDFALWARIVTLVDWLGEALARNEPSSIVKRLLELLLIAVADAPLATSPVTIDETVKVDRLLPALELLRRAPDAQLSLEQAAGSCNLSPPYFSRRFKQAFGLNFSDYVWTYRLHLAARLLFEERTFVSEIAYRTGFSSPAHFSARFRDRFGLTPREYRRSARAS